jgi:hypothetical protein
MSLKHLIPVSLLLAGAVGCDSQTDPSFRGEPLAALKGRITNSLATDPAALEVRLAWMKDQLFAGEERVKVSGDFPTAFRLDLFETPAEEVLTTFGPDEHDPTVGHLALAMILAVPPDFDASSEEAFYGPIGVAERQILLYNDFEFQPEDVEHPGSLISLFGPLEPGYHVMEGRPAGDPACGDGGGCYVDVGFDREIEVRIGLIETDDEPGVVPLQFPELPEIH